MSNLREYEMTAYVNHLVGDKLGDDSIFFNIERIYGDCGEYKKVMATNGMIYIPVQFKGREKDIRKGYALLLERVGIKNVKRSIELNEFQFSERRRRRLLIKTLWVQLLGADTKVVYLLRTKAINADANVVKSGEGAITGAQRTMLGIKEEYERSRKRRSEIGTIDLLIKAVVTRMMGICSQCLFSLLRFYGFYG